MNLSEFLIRDFRSEDYLGLLQLWEATDLGNPKRGDNEQIIWNTIQNGGRLLLLIQKNNNQIVGSSWITSDHRRLYLHHFGILPEFQGIGLGKLLCKESLKWAKEVGLQIKLEVHEKNLRALNLYKNQGFEYLGDYDVYIIRDYKSLNFEQF